MSLKASCFAVKQQFYGHFLATRIFHLATEKKISVATWRSHKKVSDPVHRASGAMRTVGHVVEVRKSFCFLLWVCYENTGPDHYSQTSFRFLL